VTLDSLHLPGNATHGFMDFMLMMGIAGEGQKADYVDTLDLFHTMEAYFTWYPNGGPQGLQVASSVHQVAQGLGGAR
jgi:protocatechuate 4,5-dioxygenase beta chain